MAMELWIFQKDLTCVEMTHEMKLGEAPAEQKNVKLQSPEPRWRLPCFLKYSTRAASRQHIGESGQIYNWLE